MGNTLQNADTGKKQKPITVAVSEILFKGTQLILPDGMKIPDAIDLLERRMKYDTETVEVNETFDVFPWDGANAFADVLIARYGWAPAEATQTFFGPKPPKMLTIDVGFNEKRTVPWGQFGLPGIEGKINTGVGHNEGRICFALTATVLRKNEDEVRQLFQTVREHLKTNSIYRGKAIAMRFRDDDGDPLQMPEPKFLDTRIDESMLVFNDDIDAAIRTNLFTPIERLQDCFANGISVKRGVLLGGPFGTGKTLTAKVAAKKAEENGLTYIYVKRADELGDAISFSKQYENPAVVLFCEDIDRALDGERSVRMDDILNVIDGVDSKNRNLITILTTNNLEGINAAMLRPGRLDAVIEVPPPDAKAVQRLLRYYGGGAIEAEEDLSAAGAALEGTIPAVIAECVKRAKLSQVRLQEPGTLVTRLTGEALADAAHTMAQQRDLLERASRPKTKPLTIDELVGAQVNRVVRGDTAFATNS